MTVQLITANTQLPLSLPAFLKGCGGAVFLISLQTDD